ncbi:hypothetical protein P4B35_19760 [Pontiellaceae bacterium B12227]|nr:hypothetical protein [Pontiellaceae bacterium B12227]
MNFKRTLLVALSLFSIQAQAIDFLATNEYYVGKSMVIDSEQWVIAGLAATDGTFENDLNIITGNPLNLNGRYNGNVTGAASIEANLNGVCERNLRLFGGTVKINGAVGGNLMAVADNIIITTNAIIEGDVLLLANSVVQEGEIEGDVSITASRITTLAGTIGGNTSVTSQEILLTGDARLAGDLKYKSPKTLYPDEGIVGGAVNKLLPPSLLAPNRLYKIGIWFMAALLAGIPFITLFPMTTAMASQLIRRSPWRCLLIGMLASGALPILGIMCISSLIGVPLGALLLATWAVMAYLSRIIMGLVIGTLILRGKGNSIGKVLAAMAIGLALIYASTINPSIGVPIQMMVLWLGMGSLILSLLEKRRLILQVPNNLKKLEKLRDEKFNPEEDNS